MSQNTVSGSRSRSRLIFTSVLVGAFLFLAANWSQQCYGLSPSDDASNGDNAPQILEVRNVTANNERTYKLGDASFTAAAAHIFSKDLGPYMSCPTSIRFCDSPSLGDFFETTDRQISIAVSFSEYVNTEVTSFVFITKERLRKWAWLRAQTGSQSSYYRVSTNRPAAEGFFAHYVDLLSPNSRFGGGSLEVNGGNRLKLRLYLGSRQSRIHAAAIMGLQTENKPSCDQPEGEDEHGGCHNSKNPCDINGDGQFSTRDLLNLVNHLRRNKENDACPDDGNFYPDYNNDGKVTTTDLLRAQKCSQQR